MVGEVGSTCAMVSSSAEGRGTSLQRDIRAADRYVEESAGAVRTGDVVLPDRLSFRLILFRRPLSRCTFPVTSGNEHCRRHGWPNDRGQPFSREPPSFSWVLSAGKLGR